MHVTFETTLIKWGNSVGFSIPKPIKDGLNLNPGDKIIITVENQRIYVNIADTEKE